MLKKYLILLFIFMPLMSFGGDDCLFYKLTPQITIESPDWSKQVVQPLQHLNLLHGNVVATLVNNYEITTDITSIEDGFCVTLKK